MSTAVSTGDHVEYLPGLLFAIVYNRIDMSIAAGAFDPFFSVLSSAL
jgi:hypothetical protein